MNEYIISESFDKTNEEAKIFSGYAENINEFIEKAFIDDYYIQEHELSDDIRCRGFSVRPVRASN